MANETPSFYREVSRGDAGSLEHLGALLFLFSGVATVAIVADPEDAYGPFPPGVRKHPESSLARAERKRGISVPIIQCPSLFVSSGEFGDERGRALASHYGGSLLEFPLLNHWDLVLNPEVRRAIASRAGFPEPKSSP
ncbi:MAG: hypothetical protein M3P18_18745 [Actinomycetota bacterium]|nr:hypothetical protein [Actinomycetota bacterium]